MLLPPPPKVMGGHVFTCIFVYNFLTTIQVRLTPTFVSYTLGHRGQGD